MLKIWFQHLSQQIYKEIFDIKYPKSMFLEHPLTFPFKMCNASNEVDSYSFLLSSQKKKKNSSYPIPKSKHIIK